MQPDQSFRLALLVTRDLHPDRTWGQLIEHVIGRGHSVVAYKGSSGFRPPGGGGHHVEIFPADVTNRAYRDISFEPQAAEILNRLISEKTYASTHAILLTMLSRRDSSGSFRMVDREVVIRHLLLGLISQIVRAAPTHFIFEETPHEVTDFALFRIARFLKIPTLFFQPSLVGPQMVARTSLEDVLATGKRGSGIQALDDAQQQSVLISRAAITKLETGGGTALLDRQKSIDSKVSAVRPKIRSFVWTAKTILRGSPNPLISLTGHRGVPTLIRNAFEVLAARSLRNTLHSVVSNLPNSSPPTGARFSLFALHYEPERTNMPEGLPYLSQLDAVLAARAMLPADVTLYIKEHYAQQSSSLRGYVGRSPLVYDFLACIPGVQVLGVEANTRELIQAAENIFTMTGKIGIEAAFLGTPAVYFGQPWWGQMPGATAFSDVETFDDLQKSMASSPAEVWRWFEKQINQELLFGLGGTSPEKYSSRIAPLPKGFEQLEFESLARAVDSFFSLVAP